MYSITQLEPGVYCYLIDYEGMRIMQKYMPAVMGNVTMNRDEADKIANYIESKMIAGLSPAITEQQLSELLAEKTIQALIVDEQLKIDNAINNPIPII